MSILDRVPFVREGYQISEMEGESLLYSHDKMTMFHLNQSAAVIWQLCDGQRTVSEIVDFLTSAYPDLSRQLERDVCSTIQQLVEDDVLRLD